jgi:hypothetical protein
LVEVLGLDFGEGFHSNSSIGVVKTHSFFPFGIMYSLSLKKFSKQLEEGITPNG